MALNADTTFQGKLTCDFKNNMRDYGKFLPEHVWKSKNWKFDGILLFKVGNLWASNLQGCFVSWQWKMIPSLNRNWLVSSKLIWGIWWILTQALKNLKNLHLNGLLLNKVCNVWTKKVQGSCLVALNIDATFEGKLTCAFKNDMRNVANFHQSIFGSLKLELSCGPFIQNKKSTSLKFTGEFYVMTVKKDAKFEVELTS